MSLVLAYLGSHSALGVYFRKDKSIVGCKHLVVLCVIELLQLRSQCVRNNEIMVDQFFNDTTAGDLLLKVVGDVHPWPE